MMSFRIRKIKVTIDQGFYKNKMLITSLKFGKYTQVENKHKW